MYALQKLDLYLTGAIFTIKTEWGLKLSGNNYRIEYLACRDNTRIPKQLEAESMRVELKVDDKAYQIRVIDSNMLGDCPVWETDVEESTQVMTDSHWMEEIEKCQVDSEIEAFREKVEARETSKYMIHEKRLLFLGKG